MEDGHGGMGIKTSDYRAVPLCHHHHQYCHHVGKKSFWEFWGKDPELIILDLNKEWERISDERDRCHPHDADL